MKTHKTFSDKDNFLSLVGLLSQDLRTCWQESTALDYHWMGEFDSLVTVFRDDSIEACRLAHTFNLLLSMTNDLLQRVHHVPTSRCGGTEESLLDAALSFLKARKVLVDEGEGMRSIVLSPQDGYTYTSLDMCGPTLVRKDFLVRRIRLVKKPRISGWIEVRRKTPLSQWMKLSQLKAGQQIPDMVGIRIVLDCEHNSPSWHAAICAMDESLSQSLWKKSSSGSKSLDRGIAFHCSRFPVRVYGECGDIQVLPIETAVNTRWSLTEVNDRFYRQRRLERFRECLRPGHLFGVDWENPAVRERQRKKILYDLARQFND